MVFFYQNIADQSPRILTEPHCRFKFDQRNLSIKRNIQIKNFSRSSVRQNSNLHTHTSDESERWQRITFCADHMPMCANVKPYSVCDKYTVIDNTEQRVHNTTQPNTLCNGKQIVLEYISQHCYTFWLSPNAAMLQHTRASSEQFTRNPHSYTQIVSHHNVCNVTK